MISFVTERLEARPTSDGDGDALQDLLASAPGYHRLVDGQVAGPGAGAELLADAGADSERVLLLLWPRQGGPVAGVLDVQLHWPEPGAAHVRLLLLRESLQGRGLGREAAHGLTEALREEGYGALRLSVTRENGAARIFWERVGFAEVERRKGGDTLHEKLL